MSSVNAFLVLPVFIFTMINSIFKSDSDTEFAG